MAVRLPRQPKATSSGAITSSQHQREYAVRGPVAIRRLELMAGGIPHTEVGSRKNLRCWLSIRSGRRRSNLSKHGVPFALAQRAFADPKRVIADDTMHIRKERRYFCFGMVGDGVLTVRFTYRSGVIRIFAAGYWRKGKTIYDHEDQIHE